MKFEPSSLLLTASLFLLSQLSLQAIEPEIRMTLKYYVQKSTSTSSGIEKGEVKTVRLDSKQLLKILSATTGVKYPSGSQLRVDEAGKVIAFDTKGNFRTDLSNYLTADFSADDALFDGKYDRQTQKENSTRYFPLSFTMNLPGLKGTITGLAIEKFKTTAANKDGIQFSTSLSKSPVSGQGLVDGQLAYFDGVFKLKGRRASIQR
jgi:hypothetical protein